MARKTRATDAVVTTDVLGQVLASQCEGDMQERLARMEQCEPHLCRALKLMINRAVGRASENGITGKRITAMLECELATIVEFTWSATASGYRKLIDPGVP